MTLGALGGAVTPLTRAEILQLPPVTTLPVLARALGVSEPVVRERRRCGDLARMGIRVLPFGRQWRVVTADVWRVLGLDVTAGGDDATA